MGKECELKVGGRLDPGEKHGKEATIVNRVMRWCEGSIEYEADPRQAENLVYALGLEGAKSVVTLGLKATPEQVAKDTTFAESQTAMFRASSPGSNY